MQNVFSAFTYFFFLEDFIDEKREQINWSHDLTIIHGFILFRTKFQILFIYVFIVFRLDVKIYISALVKVE